jgi:hypothetical protein
MADQLNFQIPQQGYDSYLYGIIPDDQAVLAGAFSTSMQQIRNIDKVNLKDFAKVAFNTESTVGLPLTGGTDIPTDTPLSTAAKIKTALGSGVYGTYTMSNFFGAMSGLPYPWVNLYDNMKALETTTLTNIYKNIWSLVTWGTAEAQAKIVYNGTNYVLTGAIVTAPGGGYSTAPSVSFSNGATGTTEIGTDSENPATYKRVTKINITNPGSSASSVTITIAAPPSDGNPPWTTVDPSTGIPVRNTLIQAQIDAANNEIEAITESSAENFEKSKVLNTLWNITGIALKHEQRARYISMNPVSVPWDTRLTTYPTGIYAFVDSIPDYAKETLPHMAAQTLEHISDLSLTGGQSIIAMMRQERNQERLSEIGIEQDNNLSNSLSDELEKKLIADGTLCGAVEGIESPDGCIYTLPAWPEDTNPVAYYDCNVEGLREILETKPGTIEPLLNGDPCPVVNSEVPESSGDPIDILIGVFPLGDDGGNIPNFSVPDPFPPNLDTTYTGTTLKPSTYNVPDAIDKVIECNCDCWVN